MSYKPKLDPIIKPPVSPATRPEDRAAVLFIHGFGDDGPGLEDIVNQFQQAGKLPHALWVLPTAPVNRDAMDTAWYTPTSLPAVAPPRPELADDEDEDGMLATVAYLERLIETEIEGAAGVPAERIVLVGFSQGCAMALLMALASRTYAGRLAGAVGLMGYLPLGAARLKEIREERGLMGRPVVGGSVMLVRGTADRLVPRRFWNLMLGGLKELDVDQERVEAREYEGIGHRIEPAVMHDLCTFLEKVIPGPAV